MKYNDKERFKPERIRRTGTFYGKSEMKVEEAEAYLNEVPKFTEKNSLEHTRECLRRLGNPQNSQRILHVAGTNGKGSTCAFLDAVLREAGYSCALFTSPHLVSVRERFVVNGSPVSGETFLRAFRKVKKLSEELLSEGNSHPTYFEMLFLMGMLIFAESKTEFCVLETGLGGRLDATTAAGIPEICVITSISLDHTQYLGNTVCEIAGEKAGILVNGVPVVYDGGNEEAAKVIADRARLLNCPARKVSPEDLVFLGRDGRSTGFRFAAHEAADLGEIRVLFPAKYQMMNAALAVQSVLVLRERKRLAVTDHAILEGLRKTCWKGRMQEILPNVFLDGAHNVDGILKFSEAAAYYQEKYPLNLLFAAVGDKEYESMIHEMLSRVHFREIVVTQIKGARQVPAEIMAGIFERQGCLDVESCPDIEAAFARALEQKGEDGVLFIAGSLYLAGEILKLLRQENLYTSV